jgi:hypothetical protein
MRIRKSVPEGYKTNSVHNAFTLFADPTPRYSSTQAQTQPSSVYNGIGYTGSKELTPFCGLMKVGGLGVQSQGASPELDDLPFLSSQGSTISTISIDDGKAGGNKRRFDEDEAEESGDIWRDPAFWDVELSPKSKPMVLGTSLTERTLAMPKSRKKSDRLRKVTALGMGLGQENQESNTTDVAMDFGEAEFLDYEILEVDMNDI